MEINIQPPTDVYETFGRLSYKPWYAVGEFVDNATQNFFDFEDSLRAAAGRDPVLTIDIDYDPAGPSLTVSDDAHGMGEEEFTRALMLTAKPPDRSGRSEFGMGLKTAACWFGTLWELSSTRLGERVEYRAVMDLERLGREHLTMLHVDEWEVPETRHGTTLRISPLRKPIYSKQLHRIKSTLASMYRGDIASGRVIINWNGEPLSYEPPALHVEELPDGTDRVWRQEIDTVVVDPSDGTSHVVRGWVGILQKMSNGIVNGFALLRRGRVVVGGPEENWTPVELLDRAGSPAWKRLTGELHVDSFPVMFAKDGFDWAGGLEHELIDVLRPIVRDYRTKANNLRVRSTKLKPVDMGRAAEQVTGGVDKDALRRDLARLESPARPLDDPVTDKNERTRLLDGSEGPTELKVPLPKGELIARLYLREDDPRVEWLTLSFAQQDEVDVFLNTQHPFVVAHSQDDGGVAVLFKFCLAAALAEKRARQIEGDRIHPDDLRTHLDTFLRHFTP